MNMSVSELQAELFKGVHDGRREAIVEAPYLTRIAGLKEPNYGALYKDIHVTDLPQHVLGQTGIRRDGEVSYVAINRRIPEFVNRLVQNYKISLQRGKDIVYKIAKLTTEHELAHAQSSRVARGEKIDDKAVSIMESVTTYAKHKVANYLNKREKARMIEQTNPYPKAWMLGKMADWAPYTSQSGEGYQAFMKDVQSERFYKPIWRLTKAAAKAAATRGRDYLGGTGVPKYAMAGNF